MGNGALLSLHSPDARTMNGDVLDESNEQGKQDICESAENKEAEEAEGIQIEGAVGVYSDNINSSFVQTAQMHNEHKLYKSLSNPDHWLRYTAAGRWMVCTTKDKDEENIAGGFCCCKISGLLEPSHAKGWFVLGKQGLFRTQTNIKVTKVTKKKLIHLHKCARKQHGIEEIKRRKVEASMHAALVPSVIKFQGATGLLAHQINGTYKCKIKRHPNEKDQVVEDKKIYYRCGSRVEGRKTTLLNDSSGRWILLKRRNVLAYCGLTGLANPCDATSWFVSNSSKNFSVQLSLVVTPANAEHVQSQNEVSGKRRKLPFESGMFSSVHSTCMYIRDAANANSSTYARRRLSSFSMTKLAKKKPSAYTKALERLKRRNKKKADNEQK